MFSRWWKARQRARAFAFVEAWKEGRPYGYDRRISNFNVSVFFRGRVLKLWPWWRDAYSIEPVPDVGEKRTALVVYWLRYGAPRCYALSRRGLKCLYRGRADRPWVKPVFGFSVAWADKSLTLWPVSDMRRWGVRRCPGTPFTSWVAFFSIASAKVDRCWTIRPWNIRRLT
jgi:hypothetical protein